MASSTNPQVVRAFDDGILALRRAGDELRAKLEVLGAQLRVEDAVRCSAAEAEARRLLAREVYGCPPELLDDVVRVRLAEVQDG